MRLDYFLAHTTGLSRKQVKQLISSGAVSIAGIERPRAGHLLRGEAVYLDGERLQLPGEQYLMLHKPAGVVCSTDDPQHPSVLTLLPAALRRELRIVGRLDIDTTGLLLLTTDGQWSHRITSPRSDCPKRYRAVLADPVDNSALQPLREGVVLRDDPTPTRPAHVELLDAHTVRLTITEGRYHQVKRMLAAIGNRVVSLHREAIDSIELDADLAPGCWRPLTPDEQSL